MNDTRIVVCGTSHKVQGVPEFRGSVEDPAYATQIEELIKTEQVDVIFEELSGNQNSAAKRLAHFHGVPHVDIDPAPQDRHLHGIVTNDGKPFPFDITPEQKVDEDSQRETVWLDRITQEHFKSGLVICGCLHTLSVAYKLRSAGFIVKKCAYVPHDVLCSHAKPRR